MKARKILLGLSMALFSAVVLLNLFSFDWPLRQLVLGENDKAIQNNAKKMIKEGRNIFRFDTFGDEAFWTDALQMNKAVGGEANGGVGPGVSPNTALAVGLKVDMTALPPSLVEAIVAGEVDLDNPATTLALLDLNSVVGLQGEVLDGKLVTLGITCALCHSTVDDAFAPGIGNRLDGWPNRDLNVGAIVSLAPDLSPFTNLLGVDEETVKAVLASWGPGKFDAHLNIDGKALRPDGGTAAVLIPPAYGLAGVDRATYTGWGSVPYWNAFVANLEMGGVGRLRDPRLNSEQFPIAQQNGFFDINNENDQITSKLEALHVYQLSIPAPTPPDSSFDKNMAIRGKKIFMEKADCASCHVPPLFTEPGYSLHSPDEIGIDSFQADRSPEGKYRTTPLKGLFSRTTGGFYHDGRFATLGEVIDHYDNHFGLGLSTSEKTDLTEYLKSI